MRRGVSVLGVLLLSLTLMAQSFPTNTFDNGSSSTPSRAYRSDPQLGSYRIQAGHEGLASEGRLRLHWSGAMFHILAPLDFRVGGPAYFQASVGIGTDTPTAALHIVGSVGISGSLTMASLGLNISPPTSTLHAVGTMAITGAAAFQNPVAIGSVSSGTSSLHVGGTSSVSGTATFLSSVTLGNASQLLTPLGTSAAPVVAPSGETGNGLYRNAASQMAFSQGLHVIGAFHAQMSFAVGTHMVAIAADGGVGTNTEILAGTRSLYLVDCNDANNCVLQLGTANIVPGATTRIFNVSTNANPVTIASVAGVQHVFSLFTMAVNHSIAFMFVTNRSGASIWVETNRNGRAP